MGSFADPFTAVTALADEVPEAHRKPMCFRRWVWWNVECWAPPDVPSAEVRVVCVGCAVQSVSSRGPRYVCTTAVEERGLRHWRAGGPGMVGHVAPARSSCGLGMDPRHADAMSRSGVCVSDRTAKLATCAQWGTSD